MICLRFFIVLQCYFVCISSLLRSEFVSRNFQTYFSKRNVEKRFSYSENKAKVPSLPGWHILYGKIPVIKKKDHYRELRSSWVLNVNHLFQCGRLLKAEKCSQKLGNPSASPSMRGRTLNALVKLYTKWQNTVRYKSACRGHSSIRKGSRESGT